VLIGAASALLRSGYRVRVSQEIENAFQALQNRATQARERLTMGAQQRLSGMAGGRVETLHICAKAPARGLVHRTQVHHSPTRRSLEQTSRASPRQCRSRQRSSPRQLVVTGVSGSGRSALLATSPSSCQAHAPRRRFWSHRPCLPIYLPLHNWRWNQNPPHRKIRRPTAKAIPSSRSLIRSSSGCDLDPDQRSRLASERAQEWQAILLLDGLDELEVEARSRVMVGCRVYSSGSQAARRHHDRARRVRAAVHLGFAAISLAPWTAKEVEQLAERWTRRPRAAARTPPGGDDPQTCTGHLALRLT